MIRLVNNALCIGQSFFGSPQHADILLQFNILRVHWSIAHSTSRTSGTSARLHKCISEIGEEATLARFLSVIHSFLNLLTLCIIQERINLWYKFCHLLAV